MPLYVPDTGVTAAEVFEELARRVRDEYALAERRILAQIARRADRLLEADGPLQRLQAQLEDVRTLREAAQNALDRINDDLAAEVMSAAVDAGSAAAVARLGLATVLPAAGPVGTGRARALALLEADLHNRLQDASQRILREAQDIYQQLAADTVPQILLGTQGKLEAQKAAVARFLDQGIPAFVDETGRRWSTGAYVEMATRTAVKRAYEESAMVRMEDAGVHLVTFVVGVGACRPCANWIGKVLSTDGFTGTLQLPNAATGELVTVEVEGTVAGARAAGWGHPNCRCTVVAYLPGLPIPAAATTYDPDAEAAMARQRDLERRLRRDKQRLALTPDGDDADALKARIRTTQTTLRDHVKANDLPRKRNREQAAFSG